ncbi:pre-mRNA splicing ATP-dependent RNA helicase [Encephalitozoon intestinalis ATCC 50506]|uniref:ATP-dependent RNA helicase n=1 Tax=Encephalitozoon intestinalis (strain ATCC 50506) TaxID=876142 RepID=E0S6Z4_ENCIT|nr:pre-mRNA splicing ATP-dependent RNA helicase [Encephalitozoon intestinalis ATCC 50506]ADM11580.1 pre-mRNA splicing ATP-dependent RNA helicase [Encephalitozoon intestinalis ATCC 50506]UTX45297.1 DEAD box RNA helicase [Encephalitozoon intestinalis]
MRSPAILRSLKNKILAKLNRKKKSICNRSTSESNSLGDEVLANNSEELLMEWPLPFNKDLLPPYPTDVQKTVIPYILAKKSINVVSETGSGKTLSYVLPYTHILENEDKRLLVIVPTRELVSQVSKVFQKFSEGLLEVLEITGEGSIDSQRLEASKPFDVVISTPGRLKELMELKSIGSFEYVVVDEADRLMQHDIRRDVAFILREARPEVTSFFSATSFEWYGGIKISIGGVSVSRNVEEFFLYAENNEKQQVLGEILNSCEDWFGRTMNVRRDELEIKKIFIFCNTIKMCEDLHERFRESLVLHSKKSMDERKTVMKALEGENVVLISTDLGGRGVDIRDVDLVINYDLPKTIEAYVHRCGRAGRQKKGVSLSMVCREDKEILPKLRRLIERKGGVVPRFMNRKEDIILD